MKIDRGKIRDSLRRIGSRAVEQESGPRMIEDRIVPTIPVSRSDAQLVTNVNDEIVNPSFAFADLFGGRDEEAPWVDPSGNPDWLAEGYLLRLRTLAFSLFNATGSSQDYDLSVNYYYAPYGTSGVVADFNIWRATQTVPDSTRWLPHVTHDTWNQLFTDRMMRPFEGLRLELESGPSSGTNGTLFYRYDVAEDWLTVPV